MASNRYLEIVKRLLAAETYFGRREEAEKPEREGSRRVDGSN